MSVQSVLTRIAEIDQSLAPRPPAANASTSFQAVLGSQTDAVTPTTLGAPATAAAAFTPGTGAAGGRPTAIVQEAAAQVGDTVQPPGSNHRPRILERPAAPPGP